MDGWTNECIDEVGTREVEFEVFPFLGLTVFRWTVGHLVPIFTPHSLPCKRLCPSRALQLLNSLMLSPYGWPLDQARLFTPQSSVKRTLQRRHTSSALPTSLSFSPLLPLFFCPLPMLCSSPKLQSHFPHRALCPLRAHSCRAWQLGTTGLRQLLVSCACVSPTRFQRVWENESRLLLPQAGLTRLPETLGFCREGR